MNKKGDVVMEERLLFKFNLETVDNKGGGDCFFLSIGHAIGKTVTELRKGVADQMRENKDVYMKLLKVILAFKAKKVRTKMTTIDLKMKTLNSRRRNHPTIRQ